ncbi:9736_t:CDS:2, partial [Paraglomus occultum]
KLMRDGLKRGPAETIAGLVGKIKGEPGGLDIHKESTIETRQYRPDLSYLVLDACLVRGGEKGPDNDDDPEEELVSKLTWTYGNCPYIFGYYAKSAT